MRKIFRRRGLFRGAVIKKEFIWETTMKIEKIKLVWFSPTGTTKKVLEGIAAGFNGVPVECIDITNPGERENKVEISATDLLILGSPVYMGRIPALLNDWFNSLKADKTPAICVVVYGNRVYDDALIELNNILCCGVDVSR